MVPRSFPSLSAVRKQHLLVEFSSLKHACPYGVFVSLTPGDPTLWSGVIFVRKGPYSPSILRFQISFPPHYPSLPPLVTFSTDIFHPLITPLTTYMYTTDIQDSGTVSATDDERLPPGGFSLRHGFPRWFGRASQRTLERVRASGSTLQTPQRVGSGSGVESPGSMVSGSASPTPRDTADGGASLGREKQERITTYEVLRYIRSTFDDEKVLDSVSLEAAGNPGAWNAWRTHRVKCGKLTIKESMKDNDSTSHDGYSEDEGNSSSAPDGYQRLAGGTSAPNMARRPGEWNWDGVWEVRVKKGVDTSITEAALFGKDAGDDLIHFLHLDPEQIGSIKENIKRSLEVVEPQRRGIV